MRYVDEYRDPELARSLAAHIHRIVTRPWMLMEICGGQTHAIARYGIESILPAEITLAHGPGCPVCVTPPEMIDKAVEIAELPGAVLCSFGDMIRVPGTRGDLLSAKARGGDVRIVYSPLDAVEAARREPGKRFVFFAVGFETTAPANAMAVWRAAEAGLSNFSLLSAQVIVPPAIEEILSAPDNRVQAFLAAGHVCAVAGISEYGPIARRHRVPIVVTGFEPLDILQGVAMCVAQLEAGRHEVEIQYARTVRSEGNPAALALVRRVFRIVPRRWRGIGPIAGSGLGLAPEFAAFDAEGIFGAAPEAAEAPNECVSGEILRGLRKPPECPAFGTRCTPEHPLGAPMVSSEGACAAYHRYAPLRTAEAVR